jgi:hypothetical protein
VVRKLLLQSSGGTLLSLMSKETVGAVVAVAAEWLIVK